MKLYHGTSVENAKDIDREGIKAVFGFVYMTPDLAVAKRFGEVIYEIDSDDLDDDYLGSYREMLCDILKTDDFYHFGGDISRHTIKKLTQ